MRRIRPDRQLPWSYRFVAALLRMLMQPLTRRDWRGAENLPRGRGFVVCPNHLSYLDPIVFAHFLFDNGHPPLFLGKERSSGSRSSAGMLRTPTRSRSTARPAGRPTRTGRRWTAVRSGKCVAIYPEGTLTRDPDLWPMAGKTGAARVALETGCPVIPVAQWGPRRCSRRTRKRLRLLPRKTMHVRAGPPVDLERPAAASRMTTGLLREATERIMAAITALLEEIRGEQAPAVRFDPPGRPPRPAMPARRCEPRDTRRRAAPTRGPHDDAQPCSAPAAGAPPSPSVLADAGTDVRMWGRRAEVVDQINARHDNTDYLPEPRAARRRPRHDRPGRGGRRRRHRRARGAVADAARQPRARGAPLLPADAVARLADEGRRARHHQADERGHRRGRRRAARADRRRVGPQPGPGDRRRSQPAASVVACVDEADRRAGRGRPARRAYFRPYTNTDVVGTELGGAVKNVIALAVGMAEGMGMGDNSKASIITRGLAETTRLGRGARRRRGDLRRAGRRG